MKWFNLDEAVKNENRETWPNFLAGEWRIARAIELEGETEELKKLKKAWEEKWETGLIRPAERTNSMPLSYGSDQQKQPAAND